VVREVLAIETDGLPPQALARIRHLQGMVAVYRGLQALAADVVVKGGAPKNVGQGQAFVAMCTGVALGIDPMVALSKVTIVNGSPTIYWDAAQALLRQRGLISGKGWLRERFEGAEGTDEWKCIISAKRADTGEEMEREFSVRDAKRAKLWGKAGPWSEFPKRMLRYRAAGFLSRDLFADVTLGLHLREELIGEVIEANVPPANPPAAEAATPQGGPDPLFQDAVVEQPIAPTYVAKMTAEEMSAHVVDVPAERFVDQRKTTQDVLSQEERRSAKPGRAVPPERRDPAEATLARVRPTSKERVVGEDDDDDRDVSGMFEFEK
jgi:hypothetical protein